MCMILPVGGFLTLGCVIAVMQYVLNKPRDEQKGGGVQIMSIHQVFFPLPWVPSW